MSFFLSRERLEGTDSQKLTINERFTNIADVVSEAMGEWWVMAVSIVAVAIWIAAGPLFNYSDTWQLLINTPTTILEMWIGFLIAAAANRTERANRKLHETMLQLIEKVEAQEVEELEHLRALDVKGHGVVQ